MCEKRMVCCLRNSLLAAATMTPGRRARLADGRLVRHFLTTLPEEIAMKINVGGTDRIVRIVVGIVLIVLALIGAIGWWGWLGLLPLATGVLRVCPAYSLLGMNTCAAQK
jgi:hypothetical protein